MTHPHACQLIYSPLSNLSLWINKAIRSIRKISTSMFATRHLCGVTYGIENLQMNHCACTLKIARRGVGDAIHNNYIICWLFALMYYSIAKYIWICMWITAWAISWTALWREILLLRATEISKKKTKYLMFTTMWSLHLQKRPSQSLFLLEQISQGGNADVQHTFVLTLTMTSIKQCAFCWL